MSKNINDQTGVKTGGKISAGIDDGPHQLVLDLPVRSALGVEDFIITESNRAAVEMIDRWPSWPHQALVICGPEGAGKTHLSNVWRLASDALVLDCERIDDDWVRDFTGVTPLVIENIDQCRLNEQALFHLLNLAKERGFHILFTARKLPGIWAMDLPDLRSRMRALPLVEIQPPDEMLLQSLLIKLFDDRQLPVSPAAIKYLARHMDRSMTMAVRLVDAVDRAAWNATGQRVKTISRDMAGDALAALLKADRSDGMAE